MKKKRKNETIKKKKQQKTNKGKSWEWSHNPHGVIKVGDKWTLLAAECYIRQSCQGCIYWRYCKQNSYEDYPIMRQVVRELYRQFGKPPEHLLDTAREYYYYNYNSSRQGYEGEKPLS